MAKIGIITIGDELLIGQTVNTNASWIGHELSLVNLRIVKSITITDNAKDISETLNYVLPLLDAVIVTGGLGPTQDDVTKAALAKYFGTPLKRNAEILLKIENFFKEKGLEMLESNRKQADLPVDCKIIDNKIGTASGMWFEKDGKIIIALPGVPYEMKEMMKDEIIPALTKKFKAATVLHRTIFTQGIGESMLAESIKKWEDKIRKDGHSLAYLPSPGIVKLRITASGKPVTALREIVNAYTKELQKLIPQWIYAIDDETLESLVGKLLISHKKTLSTAESCTGGYISHLITTIPGSSAYFTGAIVSYDNKVKEEQLGIDPKLLKNFGAVSKEVVEKMALGVKAKLKTDYAVAVSGIAGPDGGTPEKKVGTTWIAIATPEGVISKKYLFENDRNRNIRRAALTALNMLRIKIIETEAPKP